MKVRNHNIATFIILTMLLSPTSHAGESATDRLHIFIKSVVTLKANFKQTMIDSQGQIMKAQGQFSFERPGKFRWEYHQPYSQYLVADGQQLLSYDADLEQVIIYPQHPTLADTPASLLLDQSPPEDSYMLTDVPSEDGLLWVKLVPKDAKSIVHYVTLAFGEYGLQHMVIQNNFEQHIQLEFNQISENLVLAEDAFSFTPPEGVDVIGDS